MSYTNEIKQRILDHGISIESFVLYQNNVHICTLTKYDYKLSQVMASFGYVLRGKDSVGAEVSIHDYKG